MTISSTNRKAGPFTGNGITTAFPFAFKVFSTADLLVVQAVVATGIETAKTLGADYTVALNADQNTNPGGTITMLAAPAVGQTMTATSQVANLQPIDVTNGGGFYPSILNAAFDRVTIQIQQLAEKLGRTVTLALSGTANTTLPVPSPTKVLAWNAAGTALENVDMIAGQSSLSDALAASSGAALVGYLAPGSGAVGTMQKQVNDEHISIFRFMTSAQIADVQSRAQALDHTAAINAANIAVTAAGKALFWPAGTYVSSGIPTITNMKWVGENSSTTIIKLKNGTNAGLVKHTSAAGADFIWISGFTFDGNSANNTTGTVLTITGIRPTLIDLFVIKAASRGIQTNWILQGIGYGDLTGAQGYFERITVAESQEEGWVHLAPTDSYFNCIDFLNCCLKATNTYAAFDIQSNGRFSNIHPSNGGDRTIVPGVGVKVSANGSNFTNCHFEGGYTPLLVAGNCNVFENCTYYAPRGPHSVDVAGIANRITGTMGATYYGGNVNYKGVLLRGANNMVEVADLGCLNGAIDFAGSQGGNIVRVTGYHDTGVVYTGVPHAKDDVLITVGGSAGGVFAQSLPIPWTAYTPVVTSAAGALGSYTAAGRYRREGNTVHISAVIAVTSNGTGSGAVLFNLPIAAQRGLLFGREDALTGKSLQARFAPGATQAVVSDYANAYPASTGAVLVLSGSYEVA